MGFACSMFCNLYTPQSRKSQQEDCQALIILSLHLLVELQTLAWFKSLILCLDYTGGCTLSWKVLAVHRSLSKPMNV